MLNGVKTRANPHVSPASSWRQEILAWYGLAGPTKQESWRERGQKGKQKQPGVFLGWEPNLGLFANTALLKSGYPMFNPLPGDCACHHQNVRQLPLGAEQQSCCWQHDDLTLHHHHQCIPTTVSFGDGEVQCILQMRNSHPEAGWLYRGDRKPNQVSSSPCNPWNILPLIGCRPVGQSDLDITKLLSRERRDLDEWEGVNLLWSD